MPIFILAVGILLIASAINDKLPELGALVKEDMSPSDSSTPFPMWILAIVMVGMIGYIKDLKPLSTAFLVLVFVGLILSNKGFISKFTTAIKAI